MPISTPPNIIAVQPNRVWNPVRAAATTQTGLVNVPVSINSVPLGPTRDRVLLAGQTLPAENGLYQLTEFGADTTRSITASQTTTESITAARLVYVSVTGTVTVTGANGEVTAGNPGFLAPAAGNLLNITGGASGGVLTYKATVGLARTADADANGEFVSGKLADVRAGSNAGMWALRGPVSATVITGGLAINFDLVSSAVSAPYDPAATRTTVAPVVKPLGFVVAIVTSLGLLGASSGSVSGLI